MFAPSAAAANDALRMSLCGGLGAVAVRPDGPGA